MHKNKIERPILIKNILSGIAYCEQLKGVKKIKYTAMRIRVYLSLYEKM